MAAIWASCAHKWYYKTFPPQKTAVVYDVRHGMEKLINEYGLSQKYDVQVTPERVGVLGRPEHSGRHGDCFCQWCSQP